MGYVTDILLAIILNNRKFNSLLIPLMWSNVIIKATEYEPRENNIN
jgi:hypothetical protein